MLLKRMQMEKLIKLSTWCSVIMFIIRCALSWQVILLNVSLYDLFCYAGEAIGIAVIFTALYEKWLWRINPFDKTPKLYKQYTGTLKSNYDNIEYSAKLNIKQSMLSVHVTLITGESSSNSITASIDSIFGEDQLIYCYLNTPKSEFRNRSEIHYGTAIFSLTDPLHITGQYYTDRKTSGDMSFFAKE